MEVPEFKQKPSVGRIVLYRGTGWEAPAIITQVWSDSCVNLEVFGDHPSTEERRPTSVVEASTQPADAVRTWRWPPRVESKP